MPVTPKWIMVLNVLILLLAGPERALSAPGDRPCISRLCNEPWGCHVDGASSCDDINSIVCLGRPTHRCYEKVCGATDCDWYACGDDGLGGPCESEVRLCLTWKRCTLRCTSDATMNSGCIGCAQNAENGTSCNCDWTLSGYYQPWCTSN